MLILIRTSPKSLLLLRTALQNSRGEVSAWSAESSGPTIPLLGSLCSFPCSAPGPLKREVSQEDHTFVCDLWWSLWIKISVYWLLKPFLFLLFFPLFIIGNYLSQPVLVNSPGLLLIWRIQSNLSPNFDFLNVMSQKFSLFMLMIIKELTSSCLLMFYAYYAIILTSWCSYANYAIDMFSICEKSLFHSDIMTSLEFHSFIYLK